MMFVHIMVHSWSSNRLTFLSSNCKHHLPPLKKMDIWAAPDVLLIHLKRFQYTQGQYFVHRDKINEVVEFPIEGLDLTNFVKGQCRTLSNFIFGMCKLVKLILDFSVFIISFRLGH